jgi:hypothetical protein
LCEIGASERARIAATWPALNRATWSEEKRRKSSAWDGFGSVTVRFGRSI